MKFNVPKIIKSAQKSISKHSPEILTAVGIAGMITTTVLAVKATPKALELIDEEKKRRNQELVKQAKKNGDDECAQISKLKPVEVVKVAWKPYLPAALTCLASAGCLIGANSVHARRQAALYSAYKLSETAFTEYREKTKEVVGEEKEKEIRTKVSEDRVTNLIFHEDGVVHTGNGNTLFFEPISKTVFRSSKNSIDNSINDLNWKMTNGNEPYISLEEFLDELKLPKYALGNELGWRTDKGLIEVTYTPSVTDIGEPCLSVDFLVPPEWDFDNLY